MQVPHLVNEASGFGTGQLPDKEGQMYHVQNDDLYLIPTAEVPLTNLYRDTLLEASELPNLHDRIYTVFQKRSRELWRSC